MKLKEFRETAPFRHANIVVYCDQDGNELDPTTAVQRRRMLNMAVINYKSSVEGGLNKLFLSLVGKL